MRPDQIPFHIRELDGGHSGDADGMRKHVCQVPFFRIQRSCYAAAACGTGSERSGRCLFSCSYDSSSASACIIVRGVFAHEGIEAEFVRGERTGVAADGTAVYVGICRSSVAGFVCMQHGSVVARSDVDRHGDKLSGEQ